MSGHKQPRGARVFSEPSAITLLVLDVDGVLTDGSINIDDHGHETKRFHVRDGYAMKLWMRKGYGLAIITGRSGSALAHRLGSLGVPENMIIQGSKDKSEALDIIMQRAGCDEAHAAFMGDDWPDLPAIERVGFPMCPADAEAEVIERCALITSRSGGQAAVREAIAHLLRSKGEYTP